MTGSVIDYITKNLDSVTIVQTTLFKKNKKKCFDEDQALGLYTSFNLSKWKYFCLRKVLLNHKVSSDLYLSHIRPKYNNTKQLDFFPDVKELLLLPDVVTEETENMDVQELQSEHDPLV